MVKTLKLEEIKWKTRNVKDKEFLINTKIEVKVGARWREISLKDSLKQPDDLDSKIKEDDWLKLICKNNNKYDLTDSGRKVYKNKDSTVKKDEVIYGNLAIPRNIGELVNSCTWGNIVIFDEYFKVMDSDTLEPFKEYWVNSTDARNHSKGKSPAVDIVNKEMLRPYLDKEVIFDMKILKVGIDRVGLPGVSRPQTTEYTARHEVLDILISPRQRLFEELKTQKQSITMAEIEKDFSVGYDKVKDYTDSELEPYRKADIPKYITEIVEKLKKKDLGNRDLHLLDANLIREVEEGYELGYTNVEDYEFNTNPHWKKVARLAGIRKENLEKMEKEAKDGQTIASIEYPTSCHQQ